MSKLSRKRKSVVTSHDLNKAYSLVESFSLVKDMSVAGFDESVDLAVMLNTDSKKSDHSIRGVSAMPSGTGRTVSLAVFAKDDKAKEAKEAGADLVGSDELIESVKSGNVSFDKCVATPDMMPSLAKIARILGPKGLMPNPKVGTVTNDIEQTVKKIKLGQLYFRSDKGSIVHAPLGKCSFTAEQLKDNFESFISTLLALKPSGLKGQLIKQISVSSTMGPSVRVRLEDFSVK